MAKGRKDTTQERPSSSAKKPAGGKSVASSLVLNRSKQVPAEDTAAFGPIAERFRRAGDLERAVALCREGLQKFPEHLSARVTLGWALLDLGRYDEAFEALQQVLKRAPDNLAAIRGMAELHERAENAVELPLDGPGPWPPDAAAIEKSAQSTEEDEIEQALAAAGLAAQTPAASAPAAAAVIQPPAPKTESVPAPAASTHPAGEIDLEHSRVDSLSEIAPLMPPMPAGEESWSFVAPQPAAPAVQVAPPPVIVETAKPVVIDTPKPVAVTPPPAPPVEEPPVLLASNGMPMSQVATEVPDVAEVHVEAEPFVAQSAMLEPVMDEEVVPETTNFSKTEPLEAVIDEELPAAATHAEAFTAEPVEIGAAAESEEDPLDAFRLSPTPEFLATADEEVDPLVEAERAVAAGGPSLDFDAEPVVELGGYELTPSPVLDASIDLEALAEEPPAIPAEPGPALDFDAVPEASADDGFALTPAPVDAPTSDIVVGDDVGELTIGADELSLSLDFDAPELIESAKSPESPESSKSPESADGPKSLDLSNSPDLPNSPDPSNSPNSPNLPSPPDFAVVASPQPEPVTIAARVETPPIVPVPVPEPPPVFRTVIEAVEPPPPVVEAPPVQARRAPVLRPVPPPAPDPDPTSDSSDSLDVLSIVPPVLESKRKPLDKPAKRAKARREPKSIAVLEGMLRGIAVRRIEMANEGNQYNQKA